MPRARAKRETIGKVLLEVRHQFPNRDAMAQVLGISIKTLERFTFGTARPRPARRPAMLHALASHVDHALIMRLGVVMEVPAAEWPRPPAPAVPTYGASLEDALELTLFAAAERHGVAPMQARRVAIDLMAHVVALKVDAPTVHAALARLAAMRATTVKSKG
jgi:hypothetical protein